MNILIVTDAWRPQVNGVVRTYENTVAELEKAGNTVRLITPDLFRTIPCPTYPSIHLALFPGRKLAEMMESFAPDAIHIATEGPLGIAARSWCLKHGKAFTTSFHTRFPEYVRMRAPVPVSWTYRMLRNFHKVARRTLVPTPSQKNNLVGWGFDNIAIWGRGVNTEQFQPGADLFANLPGPVFLYSGRVAVEKNITAFLDLDLPGSKVVVGDGPDLQQLSRKYPSVTFTGFRFGSDLADLVASADVFVFPSLTDTFGIVLLEAMACGVPVAAFPVTGPVDVVLNGKTGILDQDLKKAALAALELDPQPCIDYAHAHSWKECTSVFFGNLVPAGG